MNRNGYYLKYYSKEIGEYYSNIVYYGKDEKYQDSEEALDFIRVGRDFALKAYREIEKIEIYHYSEISNLIE